VNKKESYEEPIKKADAEIILQSDTKIAEPEEDMPYTQKEWTENERLRNIIENSFYILYYNSWKKYIK